MKPLPNRWLQAKVAEGDYDGLDFEIVVGAPNAVDVWNRSQSFAMSRDKTPDDFLGQRVTFYVFDDHTEATAPRKSRLAAAKRRVQNLRNADIIPHHVCKDALQVLELEEKYVKLGYEGIMLSSPAAAYKYGRSTVREQGLMKYKRFYDAEAVVLDVEEEVHNTNTAQTSEVGRTKRSSAKAGLVGKGTLGAFKVRCLETGAVFSVGGGLTAEQRAAYWPVRQQLIGKVLTYKAQRTEVAGGMPRFPSFKGFRDKVEL
jgi:DNA ligase 1